MAESSTGKSAEPELPRHVGVRGATMMGLGSILGTGIFVSIGVAADAAGPAVVGAIALAALVATLNGLSSAQLAANHPVSGGTYEYGYRWLHPTFGFIAGWTFLCAKSASAATAALGFAGYALHALGSADSQWTVPLALAAVTSLTLLVLIGIRRSSQANIAIVAVTIASLVSFVIVGLPEAIAAGAESWRPWFHEPAGDGRLSGFLEASALMFVAYTGYGRIATLGEEIEQPERNIPLAIIVTLLISMLLYVAVSGVAVGSVGAPALADSARQQAAPLEVIARGFRWSFVAPLISVGAVTAMLGVLLNLILGLSRVCLAMGRRGDLPGGLTRLSRDHSTPIASVALVGVMIAGLTLLGDVKTTWSLSAFTVLIYYAITNLAATRLSEAERRYPRVIPWLGMIACFGLAFWVERHIWLIGCFVILSGLGLRTLVRR